MGKLTVKQVKAARYSGKVLKLSDGNGLYLHVTPTGRKWRYRYRIGGKPREYTIGSDDLISLSEARERHRAARLLVLDGIDPVGERRQSKEGSTRQKKLEEAESFTFGEALSEWLQSMSEVWAPATRRKNESRLRAIPGTFLALPIAKITHEDVQVVLDDLQHRGRVDAAHRLSKLIRSVLNDHRSLVKGDPVRDIRLQKKRTPNKNRHSLDPIEIGQILRDSDQYSGPLRSVWVALQLLPMFACRPGELRVLLWADVDFGLEQIVIPAERMKGRQRHIIPLSRQAVTILEKHQPYCNPDGLVLPGKSIKRPISDMSINVAYCRMGHDITGHGWRHTFSTLLNDGKAGHWHPDSIEIQLAHRQGGIRGQYNAAERLDDRRKMMQGWSDFLETLSRRH